MNLTQIAKQLKGVSKTPLLDAKLLLKNCPDIEQAIQRRLAHEPVSKIIGRRGFWKSEFITTPDVLDPRPDSEVIIEAVLEQFSDKTKPYRILDIGIGSGCLLASLLLEYPNAQGVGIDKSEKALKVAEQNLKSYLAHLLQADFVQDGWEKNIGKFDIIVSNPPYIPTNDIDKLSEDVKNYDPLLALDGGGDGLNAYRALVKVLPRLLVKDGHAFFEIGIGQKCAVSDLLRQAGFSQIHVAQDYGHIDRVVFV